MPDAERFYPVNGIHLCAQTFGAPTDPPILLVHGACASMLWWDNEFCEQLAAHGRFVIRYDQRDTGRSTNVIAGQPDYTMYDLALDALGLLDALDIPRAHLVVRSMTGAVGLILAVDHPDRISSLTLVSTTSGTLPFGDVDIPEPPDRWTAAGAVDHIVDVLRAYAGASPHFDEVAVRSTAERDVDRTNDIEAAITNHLLLDGDGPHHGGFTDVAVPTLIVHGELDPVFPPEHAHALQDAITGSTLLLLPEVGHDLPTAVWDDVVDSLVRHTAP